MRIKVKIIHLLIVLFSVAFLAPGLSSNVSAAEFNEEAIESSSAVNTAADDSVVADEGSVLLTSSPMDNSVTEADNVNAVSSQDSLGSTQTSEAEPSTGQSLSGEDASTSTDVAEFTASLASTDSEANEQEPITNEVDSDTLQSRGVKGEEPALSYHVIFDYNARIAYIGGGDSITLSDLITGLGLDVETTDIKSVTTSNNNIITPSEVDGDVVLTSLAAFTSDESIIILMNDNETTYTIKVNSDIPEHTKVLTDNGNGTFELALSVKGAAVVPADPPHVNVVVVYDVSNSMVNTNNNITRENPTGRYGIVNNQLTQLYYYVGNTRVQIPDDTSVAAGTQVYYRINYNNYSEYTGQRYDSVRRADAAEKTIYDFTSRLFNHQSSEDPSNIQMALITFSHGANVVQGWTSNKSDILNKISSTGNLNSAGLAYSRGTNYEVALQRVLQFLGNQISGYETDGDTTFVIFVTDGAPSQVDGTPDGTFLNAANCYGPSQDEARAIQNFDTVTHTSSSENPNTILYGIYAYGSEADYLDDVIYYAHHGEKRENEVATTTPTDYYYNASNTTEFNAAIDEIFNKIVETVGVTNVAINDGTTTNVTLSSGEVANLLEIDEDSFTYWMSKDVEVYTESDEYEYYTTRTDRENGQMFYVYIVDQDPTDNRIKITYDRPSDDLAPGEHSFDGWVNGYIYNNVMTIQWKKSGAELGEDTGLSPDLFFGQEPPEARVVDGSVVWNLTDENQPLLNGVTYTVKFNVWKTQRVFDIIADLENGKMDYSELEESGLDQYILRFCSDGECNYVVRTNTDATLSYSDTRVSEDEMSTSFVNPNGIAVAKETIRIEKKWVNILDQREGEDVTIILYQQKVPSSEIDTSAMSEEELAAYNEEYGPKEYLRLRLNKDDNWVIEGVNISPGLMTIDYIYETTITGRQKLVAKEGGVRILDDGYDYFFVEEGNDKYYWQLVAETIHPMVINGALTELIRMDENALNQFALNGKPLADYYIPKEFSDPNSDYLFVTSDNGNHFVKIGDYVYLINEVSEIDFITSMAGWPTEPGVPDELTVKLVDNIGNTYDTFYLVRDDSTKEGYRFYYNADDSEGHAIYSYFEKHNEFLDKYGPAGGLINYHVEVESWLSDEEYATLSEAEQRDHNRILSVISNGSLSFRHENNDINPTIGAINYRRSNLNIRKVVEGQAPEGDLFTFDINVYDPGNLISDEEGNLVLDDLYFSVWDSVANDYVDYGETISGYSKEYRNGEWTGYYHGTNSEDNILTIGLTTTQSLRFLNLTTEATYSVTEHEIEKYVFEGGIGTFEQDVMIGERDDSHFVISEEDGVITIDGTRYWNSLEESLPDSITYKILYYQEESDIYVEQDSRTVEIILDEENGRYFANYQFNSLSADNSFVIREFYADGSSISVVAINKELYNSLNLSDKTATGKIAMTNASYYVTMKNVYEVVDVAVTKVWDDENNYDNLRPNTIYVGLYAGGELVEVVTLSEENDWTYTWEDLARYSGGNRITYSANELQLENDVYVVYVPDGYAQTLNGFVADGDWQIVNSHIPLVNIDVQKVWDDVDDYDRIRPSSVEVVLTQDGDEISRQTLSDDNGWAYSWENLLRFAGEGDAHHEIVYVITETLTGVISDTDSQTTYVAVVSGNVDDGFIVTNTHTPLTSASILKVWDDAENQDGIRPSEITVILSNGESVTLNAENGWTATIDNLPAFNNGQRITYTWTEPTLPTGYTISGNTAEGTLTTITNTHTPEIPEIPEEPNPTPEEPVLVKTAVHYYGNNPLTADLLETSIAMLCVCSFGFIGGFALLNRKSNNVRKY